MYNCKKISAPIPCKKLTISILNFFHLVKISRKIKNGYKPRGLETCPQAKTSKVDTLFSSLFCEYESAPSRKYSRPLLDVLPVSVNGEKFKLIIIIFRFIYLKSDKPHNIQF